MVAQSAKIAQSGHTDRERGSILLWRLALALMKENLRQFCNFSSSKEDRLSKYLKLCRFSKSLLKLSARTRFFVQFWSFRFDKENLPNRILIAKVGFQNQREWPIRSLVWGNFLELLLLCALMNQSSISLLIYPYFSISIYMAQTKRVEVWPDSAKFRHFDKSFQGYGNF